MSPVEWDCGQTKSRLQIAREALEAITGLDPKAEGAADEALEIALEALARIA